MTELFDVIKIRYIESYKYEIQFENGVKGIYDFKDCLNIGPVFRPLKNIEYFKKAIIDGGTIAWPNGCDIAPETIYEEIRNQKASTSVTSPPQKKPNQQVQATARGPRLRPKRARVA